MYEAIKQLAQKYHQETINQRRDFHHFAERGWLEIRTACQIATTLENLGYEVLVGKEIMDKDARMGLPPEAIFNINYLRAKKEGANPKYLEQVKNGMTAVAGILKNGVGPVVAIRFDIDALGLVEEFNRWSLSKTRRFFFLSFSERCMLVDMMVMDRIWFNNC